MKPNYLLEIIALFFLGLPFPLFGKTQVAWLELRDQKGQLIQLESDFYYAHVAIKVHDRWLHANPRTGVEMVTEQRLETLGKIKEILETDLDELNVEAISGFIHKPFDNEYSWSDEKIYCAELVAKLLDVAPSPMHFDSKYWNPWFQKYEGLPGASPGKLYQVLLARGYHRFPQE